MTKKIFRYMELTILVTLIGGFIAILLSLYGYFSSVQKKQLKVETELAAKAIETGGTDFLDSLHMKGTRVTWIAADGTVLFDNEADAGQMENHASRPEIAEALENGEGASTRYSDTMTTAMLYYAMKLSDGSVVRVSESRNTVLTVALGMVQPLIWIFLVLMGLTWLSSSRLSRKVVDPLNNFDLDHPLDNETYPEMAPFLHHIYEQQEEIEDQKEHLQKTEKDFLTVTNRMEECLILLSPSGKILTINQQAMKLLHTDESCIGEDILYLDRRTEFEQALQRAAKGEHSELILDYSGRSYQADISPVSTDSMTAGMVVLLFDVTDREKAEQLRREFSSNVSHELKTPLHTISGCAELLETGQVKQEDRARFVHTIYTQAQRMITLVEDILYISHLDEGAIDMHWEKVDLYEVTLKVTDQLQQEALKNQVTLTVNGAPAAVDGIFRLIESIIFNLIDNAIKYNRSQGRVDITVEDRKDTVVFRVQDNGIGIPEEDQPRIFERFFRVDKSHSREIGGTGLGLSIVKHAAEIMHAHIDVDSRPGKGSTFTVAFHKNRVRSGESQD